MGTKGQEMTGESRTIPAETFSECSGVDEPNYGFDEDLLRDVAISKGHFDKVDIYSRIYVMRCAGYYKIGLTRVNIETRRAEIQACNPYRVDVIRTVAVPYFIDRVAEKYCHTKLLERNIHGEWFDIGDHEIDATISGMKALAPKWISEAYDRQSVRQITETRETQKREAFLLTQKALEMCGMKKL